MDFVDCYVEKRIRKNTFFKQINTLINWKEIDKEKVKVYKRGHLVVRYLKKGKNSILDINGMQLSVHTTCANQRDSKGLKPY